MPGLVECHTHAVWAGSRADEWARRLAGESYAAILEQGGGILSTVRATRAATLEALTKDARARVRRMRDRSGVTTVEIKSGYGLDPATEEKILRAARACDSEVRVVSTFLGAHTLAPEFRGDAGAARGGRAAYVRQVIEEQLPRCAPLADCADVFCDSVGFTLAESRAVLEAAKAAGLTVKAHCEQIERLGGSAVVAELAGVSADHVERATDADALAMGRAGTVAVLLPGAQLYLKDHAPPVALFRKHGVRMAVGTDLNPGTSPVHDLWACAALACVTQGLTIAEAVQGITRNAGLALGRSDLGWLGEGSVGDLALFEAAPGYPPTVESLVQNMGGRDVRLVVRDGRVVFEGRS
jgi:imidazolonepropionase